MRRLSQVFLRDTAYIDRIISEVSPQPSDFFLEVGPGQGALTRPLLEHGARVMAVELDLLLVDYLVASLSPFFRGRLSVIQGDYIRLDVKPLVPKTPVRFISNLPYHISTPAIEKLVEEHELYLDAHLMLQKELAERICSVPGTKEYGYSSVLVRLRYEPRVLFRIPPSAFSPAPRVTSAFVRLARAETRAPDRVILKATNLASSAFRFRRRAIRNSLRPVLADRVLDVLEEAGVSPEKRADQVSPEEYLEIARVSEQLPSG